MVSRSNTTETTEIEKAREELAAVGVRAMSFVAAILVLMPERTIEPDPWRLALLRMVNCLDLGDGPMAAQILRETLDE